MTSQNAAAAAQRYRVQFTEETAYEAWVEANDPQEAAQKVARKLSDEGPDTFTIINTSACNWLVFDRDGVATDVDDGSLLEDESE
jgi:hypothetical protein